MFQPGEINTAQEYTLREKVKETREVKEEIQSESSTLLDEI